MTSLVDAKDRELAGRRSDRNVRVEGGAGSGTTKSLVDRVCQLVGEGKPIRSIAAVTFTEAAASELRDRLRAELADIDAEAVVDLDAAAIGTLHSFARRILAEHPVEADLPPVMEVLDDVASTVRLGRWWSTVRAELLADDAMSEPVSNLMDAGVRISALPGGKGAASLESLALALQNNWDLVEDHLAGAETPDIPEPDLKRCRELLVELEHLRLGCTDPQDKLHVRIVEIIEWGRRLLDAGGVAEILDVLNSAPRRAGKVGIKKNWPDVEAARAAVAEFREFDPLAEVFRASLQHVLAYLSRVILDAADERRRDGQLLYHDLLVLARRVLRSNAEVRVELQKRYPYLLLDEFQDTDPIQVELAVRIAAGADGGEADWRNCQVPEGSLFVVGDPKQSIYRFRRADIATFMQLGRFLGSDARAELSTNFRSHAQVLNWVNHVFGALISEQEGVQPAYIPLDPSPKRDHPADRARVVMAVPDPDELDSKQAEAARVVDVIATALAEQWPIKARVIRPSDITVLVPARTQLDAMEAALTAANVPYRLLARSLIYSSEQIRDLLLVASAADDPTNELILAEALRTPILRCGDDDLWRWKHAGGSWQVWADPPGGLPADDPVGPGMAFLNTLNKRLRRMAPSEVLTQIIEDHDLLALAAASPDPSEIWRRYRIVVDQARQWSESAHGSLREYLQWARARADGEEKQNEIVLPEHDADEVSVMTIHAAKGLQFGMVVVTGLIRGPKIQPGPVVWTDDGPQVSLARRVATELWSEAAKDEQERLAQEDLRLSYVACTRAEEYLVVSGFGKNSDSRGARLRAAAADAPHEVWSERGTLLPARAVTATPAPDPGWLQRHEQQVASSMVRESVSAGDIAHGEAPTPKGLLLDLPAGLAKGGRDLERPAWEKGRYGTAVGRAVHATLQTVDLATGEGLEGAARAQALAEGVADREDVVVALARSGFDAPATRAAAARPHQKETYVGTVVDGQVVEGVIDLLYTDESGGIVVVDYKTDASPDTQTLEVYQKQLGVYAAALADATGLQVARRVLVFCREEGAIEVAV